jgi:hypothetical protein
MEMPRRLERTHEELADQELEYIEALGYGRLAYKDENEQSMTF